MRRAALRVPQITVYFWVIKALSTALGESTSDYLVHRIHPVPAVLLGFTGFVIALALQFSMRRYVAWTYWFAVVMVGVFGTMAADVLHVGFHVPYIASSLLYAIVLAAVFFTWQRTEHTLSIHSIDTARREAFYWAAVVATFAMGTALGDLTSITFHLGYFASGILFSALILIPAIGYRWFGMNSILAFWIAYVLTRPVGASFADWFGKPVAAARAWLRRRHRRRGAGRRHLHPGRLPRHHARRRPEGWPARQRAGPAAAHRGESRPLASWRLAALVRGQAARGSTWSRTASRSRPPRPGRGGCRAAAGRGPGRRPAAAAAA